MAVNFLLLTFSTLVHLLPSPTFVIYSIIFILSCLTVHILPYNLYLICYIMTADWFKVKKNSNQNLPYYDCVSTVQMLSQLVWYELFFLVSYSHQANVIFAENLKEVSQHENQSDFLLLCASSCLSSFHDLVCCSYIPSVFSSTLGSINYGLLDKI